VRRLQNSWLFSKILAAMWRWTALGATVGFVGLSAYGWWFFFAVGEAHGPGAEVGIIGAVVAVLFAFLATRAWRGFAKG
jgi:hypothetical protein